MVLPGRVAADEPPIGSILVLEDHVLPGGPMTVVGIELDDGLGPLQLFLDARGSRVSLGSTPAIAAGSTSVRVQVPSDFPTGYALLTATAGDATRTWSTYVLVGERAEGPKSGGSARTSTDTSGIGIAMIVIGLSIVGAAGAWHLRGRLRFRR